MTGSGTIGDPYIIYDVTDLQAVNNDLTAYYELANDIDASDTATWNGGQGFVPLGYLFTGHFDGKNHRITSLYINRPASSYQALFDGIGGLGTVRNVGIENAYIRGDEECAGLTTIVFDNIGADAPSLSGCWVKDSEIVAVDGYAGGMFSYARRVTTSNVIAENCWVDNCEIYNESGGQGWIGGFCSYPDVGTIRYCYAKDIYVHSTAPYNAGWWPQKHGGFAASIQGGSGAGTQCYVQECWCSGIVEGEYNVAGFAAEIGLNALSTVIDCYTRCSVEAKADIGPPSTAAGFVSLARGGTSNGDGAQIINCYSTGLVTSTDLGSIGFGEEGAGQPTYPDAVIQDCHTDGQTNGCAGNPGDAEENTTAEMIAVAAYTNWDFTEVWCLPDNCNDGYPILRNNTPPACDCLVSIVTVVPALSRCAGPYTLLLYGVGGAYSASASCFLSLEVRRRVNAPDSVTMVFDGRDEIIKYLTLDTQIEIWRSNPLLGISLYKEAELFHRTGHFEWDENAQATYISRSVGYEDLLNRRILLGGDDEVIFCTGLYPAETVMKEIVKTQCGLAGLRSLSPGNALPGLSVEGSDSRGDVWKGYRQGMKVLAYLQEIAEGRDMALRVIGTDPATFIFQAYPNPYGADRTATDINRTTGRNFMGNMPIIFSEERGNVSTIGYESARDGEGNVAIDLYNNLVVEGVGMSDSPWNRCEFPIVVSPNDSSAEVAASSLERMKAREGVPVGIIQTPHCAYGRHYFLGDRISVHIAALEKSVTMVITGVIINVSRVEGTLDERIKLELSAAPTDILKSAVEESLTNLDRRLRKLELW